MAYYRVLVCLPFAPGLGDGCFGSGAGDGVGEGSQKLSFGVHMWVSDHRDTRVVTLNMWLFR